MVPRSRRDAAVSRHSWQEVYEAELDLLRSRHGAEKTSDDTLIGLALSGGGIRSATFGLGVLEGLKQCGVLKKFHYLSTVSGGGYIGGWLSGNCIRRREWLDPAADWTDSVAHLRRYSNYLSPSVGFFSADTWSMFTVWLQNTLLVQVTVILAIAFVLLLPRVLFEGFRHWPEARYLQWPAVAVFVLGVVGIAGNQLRLGGSRLVELLHARTWRFGVIGATVCLAVAGLFGVRRGFDPFSGNRVDYVVAAPIAALVVIAGFLLLPAGVKVVAAIWPTVDRPQRVNYTQGWVQALVVVPILATSYFVAAILWDASNPEGAHTPAHDALFAARTFGALFTTAWEYWPFPISVVFVSVWLLSFCSINRRNVSGVLAAVGAPFVAVPVLHSLLCAIILLLHQWSAMDTRDGAWHAFVWAPGLALYAFAVTVNVLIGMLGRQSSEGIREWWSRLGAWMGIYGVAWFVLTIAAVYGPRWTAALIRSHPWTSLGASAGWIATVSAGLLAGQSERTGTASASRQGQSTLELIAKIAPFVFIAGLLILVSTALEWIVTANAHQDWTTISVGHQDPSDFLVMSLIALGACLVGLVVMAARIDINQFSLNAFYRNRLVRCYLGATRRADERRPENFTGFDDDDDMLLTRLAASDCCGPLHLVNCALNLGGSSDLALHTRHSATFTLTPLHCGSSYVSRDQSGGARELGYVTTGSYGGTLGEPTLGQAISVSGAAASPNMGYHTSPVVAFLLTVFNIRLGWWFPNPSKPGVRASSPRFNLPYLFAELFGEADEKSKFVMISDGGHFENLAAYELVKRRCRVIVISDAECDPNLECEGLGTLIRMCAVDFGTRIVIDVSGLKPEATSAWSASRCAVGRIIYGDGHPDGILIYLKASMTGHEDTPILQYKASHRRFPHESTSDQFYGEAQFESYRGLGREIAVGTFEPALNGGDLLTVAHKLVDIHSPRSAAPVT